MTRNSPFNRGYEGGLASQAAKPTFQPPDLRRLFRRPPPVIATEGLRYSGDAYGALLAPEASLPRIDRPMIATPSAAVTQSHNWMPKKVDATHLTITSGNAAGAVATMGGVTLDDDPPPQLTVSATELVYVYVCVTYSLDIDSGIVRSGTVVSRAITAESAELTSTDTERYFLLFKWKAGTRVEQKLTYSFEADCSDDGYARSKPLFQTWPAA